MNTWPSRNATSSQFEALDGAGAAIFVIVNPDGTDGAAADAPPAAVRQQTAVAASAAAIGLGLRIERM
jgi:hypothetical protein